MTKIEEMSDFEPRKTMLQKATLLFADVFSALPIAFYFSNVKDAFFFNKFKLYIVFIICMLISDLTAFKLKQLNYPNWFYKTSRRPLGSSNTDVLSRNGKTKKDSPGFPSGHITLTTFYCLFMIYMKYMNSGKYSFEHFLLQKEYLYYTIFFGGIIIIMMWARWYKGVHNMTQIYGGLVVGSGFFLLFSQLVYPHLES